MSRDNGGMAESGSLYDLTFTDNHGREVALADFAGKTVVSFCTGGIRCEKAAILMREEGLEHVYQLEGGILKYFELTDGAHWQGDCFVFDAREALGAQLTPKAPAA